MFLNIIPYKRYHFYDKVYKGEPYRGASGDFLSMGNSLSQHDIMILGIIETSRAYKLISRERGEVRKMRRKNIALQKAYPMTSGINQAIREVQAAIAASVTAAMIATHSSH